MVLRTMSYHWLELRWWPVIHHAPKPSSAFRPPSDQATSINPRIGPPGNENLSGRVLRDDRPWGRPRPTAIVRGRLHCSAGGSPYGTESRLAHPAAGGAVEASRTEPCRCSVEHFSRGTVLGRVSHGVDRYIYTIITFGLLVVAVVAALYAKKQWQIGREQAEDARTAQVEASRPYAVVAIEPSGASRHLFDLTVRNIGQRPALSVSATSEAQSWSSKPYRIHYQDGQPGRYMLAVLSPRSGRGTVL